uniref:hypothetical protein n=1 Tax=Lachnobacterium bovis TaxID=140626 RepID=UPI00054CDAE8
KKVFNNLYEVLKIYDEKESCSSEECGSFLRFIEQITQNSRKPKHFLLEFNLQHIIKFPEMNGS